MLTRHSETIISSAIDNGLSAFYKWIKHHIARQEKKSYFAQSGELQSKVLSELFATQTAKSRVVVSFSLDLIAKTKSTKNPHIKLEIL